MTFEVSASDESGEQAAVRCTPASGSLFHLGATTVTCNANAAGSTEAHGSFDVVVRDTTRPELTLQPVDPVEAIGRDGAPVTFRATARDLVGGELSPACSPASGARFPIGTRTVECTVTDAAGNTARGSFAVTVFDAPPQIDPHAPITVDYTSTKGTRVAYTVTATDRVDGALKPTCTPASGSLFPLGTTTVKCTVTDSGGKQASAEFPVTVHDGVPPVLTLPEDLFVIAAYGAKTWPVTFSTSAWDAVDGDVAIICKPPSGSSFTVWSTTTVNCSARDKAGNLSKGSFKVTVQDDRPR